jgi:hypothetical protein
LIDIELVETSIDELENSSMNYEQCRNLAALYSVRDNYYHNLRIESITNNSEFLQVINGLPVQKVLAVIDELMSITKATDTRLYDAVIKQIKEIRVD